MRLRELVEAARRTKTMDFEWAAEACRRLLRSGGVDEGARREALKIVEEVVGSLNAKLSSGAPWALTTVWPLYERLLAAVELLAERPDREAAQRLCDALKAMKVELEEVAIKHLL